MQVQSATRRREKEETKKACDFIQFKKHVMTGIG